MSQPPSPPQEPVSQARPYRRRLLPDWMQQLPLYRMPTEPNFNFQLIPLERLETILKDVSPAAAQRIREDLAFLDHELLRFFRERDFRAKYQQNRHRVYQIIFMILAAVASIIGSLQALSVSSNPTLTPTYAFLETLIALLTAYLATTSRIEPSATLWTTNRRRAEALRREYYRFLMNLAPYDGVDGFQRRMLLSRRAADINRGVFPEESEIL